MGLFDKKSTQTTTIPKAGANERGVLEFLTQLSRTAGGQTADLSDLASGNLPGLSPEMKQMVQDLADSMIRRESTAINQQYKDGLRDADNRAAELGQTDDSIESVYRAIVGRERQTQLGDLNERASGMVNEANLTMPFQIADLQTNINDLLYRMALSGSGSAANSYLQDRMARPTTTSESSGGLLGLSPLASALFPGGSFDIASLLKGKPSGAPVGDFIGPPSP